MRSSIASRQSREVHCSHIMAMGVGGGGGSHCVQMFFGRFNQARQEETPQTPTAVVSVSDGAIVKMTNDGVAPFLCLLTTYCFSFLRLTHAPRCALSSTNDGGSYPSADSTR